MSAADATLHSSLWYRAASLRPQLRTHAKLHRHRYRGEVWYLLQDPASGRIHRFTPAARLVLAAMDGRRTVHDLWQLARRRLGEDAPTQDELIQLLGQLHGSDLLASEGAADVLEASERGERIGAARRRRAWANPMAVRIPLWDPGAFLDRHLRLWCLIWSRAGALLWMAVVLPAVLLLPAQWPELTGNVSDRVLQAENLLLLGAAFLVIKALHELGHATAARAAGGEVHDMGVMLLVLMPVPYVDATSASALGSKWQRALVGSAGMVVELFIAALAFYLWLAIEPGLVRALCLNVMAVAGISTLIFNGNPLLRYDAYYILADLIEMPNLGQRAARYWGYLIERHVLRLGDVESAERRVSDRWWLVCYGLASAIYRLFVTFAIALFIGARFFFVGVILALWAVAMMVGAPIVRALRHLRSKPAARERGLHITAGAASLALVASAVAFLLPIPCRTVAEGVVWLPENAIVRAGVDGFVARLEAEPGQHVTSGQALLNSTDPALVAQLQLLTARVAELEANYAVEFVSSRANAGIVRDQLRAEQAALERVRERVAAFVARAQTDGSFTVVAAADLPGRWAKKGEVLGYVLGDVQPLVRVVIEQAEADLVTVGTPAVALRLADEVGRVIGGRIVRHVPAGTDQAPSRALVASGGGRLAADPRDEQGRKMLERAFEVDVAPKEPLGRATAYGQRVFVRFDLPPAPLATQAWRALRRLFLTHFDV